MISAKAQNPDFKMINNINAMNDNQFKNYLLKHKEILMANDNPEKIHDHSMQISQIQIDELRQYHSNLVTWGELLFSWDDWATHHTQLLDKSNMCLPDIVKNLTPVMSKICKKVYNVPLNEFLNAKSKRSNINTRNR